MKVHGCWLILGLVVGCKGDDASSCAKVAAHMHQLMRGDRAAMPEIDGKLVKLLEAGCIEEEYTPKFRACVMAAKTEADLMPCMGAPKATITFPSGTHVGPEPVEEDSERARIRQTFSAGSNDEWQEYCRVGGERHGPYRRVELSDSKSMIVREEEVGAFDKGQKTGTWKISRRDKPYSQEDWVAGRKHGTHTIWDESGYKLSEQSYKEDQPDGVQRRWHDAEQLATEEHYTAGQKDGAFVEWSTTGTKTSELAFAKGTPIGAHLEWHENGEPSTQGAYVDGELHGPWRELSPSGKLVVEGTYIKGKKSGTWKYSRANGSKMSEGGYADDERRGTWTFFDTAGSVVASVKIGANDEVEVEEDEDGLLKTIDVKPTDGPSTHLEFFAAGALRVRGGFLGGEKHGPWIELDRKGNKVVDLVYKNGVKHGPASGYHEDSKQLADQGTMEDGEWNGPWKQWYEDGKLRMEGVYVKGKRDGLWTEYHPKGHKWREGKFRLGEKYGTWTTWDGKAKVESTEELGP